MDPDPEGLEEIQHRPPPPTEDWVREKLTALRKRSKLPPPSEAFVRERHAKLLKEWIV